MRPITSLARASSLLASATVWTFALGLDASRASAATITSVTLTDLSSFDGSSADADDQYVSTLTEESVSCGGSCMTFESHFAGNAGLWVDFWDFNDIVTFSWSYQIDFYIDAAAGELWMLQIDTSLLGALTLVDSAAGNARAVLNDVTGTYSGPGTTSGTLDLAGFGTLAGAAGGNTPVDAGDRTALFTVTDGVGPTSISLTFTMTGEVFSDCGGFLCLFAGDQASVRMGADDPGTLDPGFTAGDYPGVGGRTAAGDGHFARYTLLPEPSTAVLLSLGLLGLAILGRPRRRRVAPAVGGRRRAALRS